MDLLVQHGSAHGIGKVRSIPFEPDRAHHIGGRKHHFDLLADPTVYDKLREWLDGADGAGRSDEDTDATRRRNRRRRRPPRGLTGAATYVGTRCRRVVCEPHPAAVRLQGQSSAAVEGDHL